MTPVLIAFALFHSGAGQAQPNDAAVAVVPGTLSVVGLNARHARALPLDFVVRVPRKGVVRARLQVVIFGGRGKNPLLRREYFYHARSQSEAFGLVLELPAATHAESSIAVLVRVGGVLDKGTRLQGFRDSLTYRIELFGEPAPSLERRMPERILFDTLAYALTAEHAKPLAALARRISRLKGVRAVRIEGHADRRGSAALNMELSRRRADSVADGLMNLGVPRERIEILAMGFEHPFSDEHPAAEDAGHAADRRVEVVVDVQKPVAP